MKSKLMLILAGGVWLLALEACKQKAPENNAKAESAPESVQFVSDESFAPILDQELYIFKSVQSPGDPRLVYRSENETIAYLLKDSSRFGFLSRELTPAELKMFKERNLPPVVTKFAIDAITIIVNEKSNDTTITVGQLKKMLTGQDKADKSIVFDNPNSSLVRYLKELAGGADLKQKNIYALKSNKEVIEYVSNHPEAIGITGFSWLNDPDADYAAAVNKVKIVAVGYENSKDAPNQYFKPSQTTLSLKQYPLLRYLYIVNCLGSTKGLGAEFEHFLVSERGQRIVLRSGLLPAKMPGREIIIHSNKL